MTHKPNRDATGKTAEKHSALRHVRMLFSTRHHYVSYRGKRIRIYQRRTGIEMHIPYETLRRILLECELLELPDRRALKGRML